MAQASEAQLKANKNYKSKSVKRFTIDFYPSDMELFEYLQKAEKKQTYIKDLIRKDMEENGII